MVRIEVLSKTYLGIKWRGGRGGGLTQERYNFDLGAVKAAIAGTEFAGCVVHVPTTPSTNDLAHQAAHAGARRGVWIADEQTAGRGRGGHTWHSTPGEGLYMSAIVSPDLPMQSALHLSLATAIAAQSAISFLYGFRVRHQIDIRWPNDLMLVGSDGKARKLGGILIETAAQPAPATGATMLRYATVGIGINLNHTAFPPELDAIATSIRRDLFPQSENSRKRLPREPLAAAILVALDAQIRALVAPCSPFATHNFSLYSSWIIGKRVRVESPGSDRQSGPGSYTGVTAGLDPQGFLRVAGDDGCLHTVLSGGLREP